ncbi:MAG TPA: hypothetical protein VLV88_13100 [Terriglobales bacterium]|nr:hypothetical protein [Terriglobales bacterium]
MVELSPQQIDLLKRLFAAGFRPIAIPPYESALCIHRGECAALLAPVEGGGLRLLSPPTFLVDGNLGVRIKRTSGDVFVWKHSEMEATPERLRELEGFAGSLDEILRQGAMQ